MSVTDEERAEIERKLFENAEAYKMLQAQRQSLRCQANAALEKEKDLAAEAMKLKEKGHTLLAKLR